MQHFQKLDDVFLEPHRIAIGVYDGVHRGHQVIINHMVAEAHAAGEKCAVVTFFPNPAVLFGRAEKGNYITSPAERADLLGALGVDTVVTLPFTLELAQLSALDFMQLMKTHLQITHLYAGDDFALGRGREGNISKLKEIGQGLHFGVSVISAVQGEGERISSSRIRSLIQAGKVRLAGQLLGRYYRVSGPVVHGQGRGAGMGFATANIDYWSERVMPAFGIYATWLWVNGVRQDSVSNLGVRPTVDAVPSRVHLEAHALDKAEDLYGASVELEFVEYLRTEMRFESVDELIAQVNRDKQTAREVLQDAPDTPGLPA